jgi:hypothetical protein
VETECGGPLQGKRAASPMPGRMSCSRSQWEEDSRFREVTSKYGSRPRNAGQATAWVEENEFEGKERG